jgi:tRNA(Arg) A34 adenosine deaminase TadA
MTDDEFMRLAIEKAKEGIRKGQTPFGACIVKDSDVVSCAHNTVWRGNDVTCHAEINAIRMACKKLNTVDLSGCVIYTTTEPCPMCFGASHWARISKIVYGSSIEDSKQYGFNELVVTNKEMKSLGKTSVELVGGFARDECLQLFKMWNRRKAKRPY